MKSLFKLRINTIAAWSLVPLICITVQSCQSPQTQPTQPDHAYSTFPLEVTQSGTVLLPTPTNAAAISPPVPVEGSAANIARMPSASPTGPQKTGKPLDSYDAQLVDKIEQHWDGLLNHVNLSEYKKGKLVMRFRLHPDGTISDTEVVENTSGSSTIDLCRQAITDVAPFGEWPPEMRQKVGRDFRTINFTFDLK